MKILSFNAGHDGAFAYLENGRLITSVESEKDSHYRHSPVSITDLLNILGDLKNYQTFYVEADGGRVIITYSNSDP